MDGQTVCCNEFAFMGLLLFASVGLVAMIVLVGWVIVFCFEHFGRETKKPSTAAVRLGAPEGFHRDDRQRLIHDESGFTRLEKECHDALMQASDKFFRLAVTHPDDHQDWAGSIHCLQDLLAMRILRRDYPRYWKTYDCDPAKDIEPQQVERCG